MSEETKSLATARKTIRPWQWRYGLAVFIVTAALGLRMALTPFLEDQYPFAAFYVAVTITAWRAGFGPSIAALIFGYGLADWFFIAPVHTIGPHLEDPMPILIYFFVTGTICVFARSMHNAEGRAEQKHELLEAEIAERNRVELELLEAQKQLRLHAAELEQRVAERTAKLQESVESLEGVCYSIAHDLRAPIRAMQGYATALEEDVPTAGKNYTQRIRKASVRMDQLVQDLLAYGRLSHQEMKLATLDLETQVDCVIKNLAEEIRGQNAVLNVQRPLPKVLANEIILRQVLTNLLSNALKFVRLGVIPTIHIYAKDNDRVRLFIEDNGIGIEACYHERIFKVFERLHAVETYSGTGIGLAIVKKGAEKMGGKAGVKSEPGKGSCFWIELQPAT